MIWGPDRQLSLALGLLVARKTGRPLFAEEDGADSRGEAAASAEGPAVRVVGPDKLIDRHDRLNAIDQSVVVCVERADAPASSGEALRAAAYREAHWHASLRQADLEAAAEQVSETWRRQPVAVAAGLRSYRVDVGGDWPLAALTRLAGTASSVLLVTDNNVRPLHAEGVLAATAAAGTPTVTVELRAGEENKHLGAVDQIWRAALASGIDRQSLVIGLGGGVVTDIAGFAASTWMRGLRWVGLPTTLLAMVDASVGGKTGVDLEQAKNAIGAFWQPEGVFCGTRVLETEPERGFRGALAEAVKTALIGDPELLGLLERRTQGILAREPSLTRELVRRCVCVKARVVGLDEREAGLRAVLNLGHTIGHALEAAGGYAKWTHGEAVSLGLVAALQVGVRLGRTPVALVERVVTLLGALGLPRRLEAEELQRALKLLAYDKKRAGRDLSFVVAQDVGDVRVCKLSIDELQGHIRGIASDLGPPTRE